jgi:hypothetical protein
MLLAITDQLLFQTGAIIAREMIALHLFWVVFRFLFTQYIGRLYRCILHMNKFWMEMITLGHSSEHTSNHLC